MVERVIPQEDGSVKQIIHPGAGEAATERVFESDEAYWQAQAEAQQAELRARIRHPVRAISEHLLGGEPNAA